MAHIAWAGALRCCKAFGSCSLLNLEEKPFPYLLAFATTVAAASAIPIAVALIFVWGNHSCNVRWDVILLVYGVLDVLTVAFAWYLNLRFNLMRKHDEPCQKAQHIVCHDPGMLTFLILTAVELVFNIIIVFILQAEPPECVQGSPGVVGMMWFAFIMLFILSGGFFVFGAVTVCCTHEDPAAATKKKSYSADDDDDHPFGGQRSRGGGGGGGGDAPAPKKTVHPFDALQTNPQRADDDVLPEADRRDIADFQGEEPPRRAGGGGGGGGRSASAATSGGGRAPAALPEEPDKAKFFSELA